MSENPSQSHLLDLQAASVHYGRAIALASVTLTVDKGELVAVIGPNGPGKPPLLRPISGLLELKRGKILFEENLVANPQSQNSLDLEEINL